MKIRKNSRKIFSVINIPAFRNPLPVEYDGSLVGNVESGKKLKYSGFAAAVPPDKKDYFRQPIAAFLYNNCNIVTRITWHNQTDPFPVSSRANSAEETI
jgi:hypothetical protein|tara:strand:+ start:382 stop:678 length:297 start_codon:yes stop_codon:yes gene_type:complete